MNVIWEENGRRRGRPLSCEEIAVDRHFIWNGWQLRIPAVYRCRKGIVIDVLRRIPAEQITRFAEKYRDSAEDDFTEAERSRIEYESPLETPYRLTFALDGIPCGDWHSHGDCWYPQMREFMGEAVRAGEAAALPQEEWLAAYACDRNDGWGYQRWFLPWKKVPENARLTVTVSPKKFSLGCEPEFETVAGETARTVEVVHPLDGSVHTLLILRTTDGELAKEQEERLGKEYDIPTHYQQLDYRMDTEADSAEFTVYPCKSGDAPVRHQPDSAASASAAKAIGIIGGADGPTAVFFTGKSALPQTKTAVSGLSFQPAERVSWRVWTQISRGEDTEIAIDLSSGK